MRRLVLCVTALLLLLASCGEKEQTAIPDLEEVLLAADTFNGNDLRAVKFLLNVTEEGAENSAYFTQGNVAYRRVKPVAMSGRSTQIYRGVGSTADMYYKAGAYYRGTDKSKYYLVMDKEKLLGQCFCADIPTVDMDAVRYGSTAQTDSGTKYTLGVSADEKTLKALFEETLNTSLGLKKPDGDRTVFGEPEYVYVIGADGSPVSFKLTVDVTVYETAPYYPNYAVPDEELVHKYKLEYELAVTALGDSVNIVSPVTSDYTFLS